MKNRLWLIVLSAFALCVPGFVHAGKKWPKTVWKKLDLTETPPVQEMSRDSEKAGKAPAQKSHVTFNPIFDTTNEAGNAAGWPGVATRASLKVSADNEDSVTVDPSAYAYEQVLAELATDQAALKKAPEISQKAAVSDSYVSDATIKARHGQVMAQLVAGSSASSVTVEDRKSALPGLNVLMINNTDGLEAAAMAAIAAKKAAAPLADEAAIEVAAAPVTQSETAPSWWNLFSWGSSAPAAPADVLKEIGVNASKAQDVQSVSVESALQPAVTAAPAVAQAAQSVEASAELAPVVAPVVEVAPEEPGILWNTARPTRFARVIGGLKELQGSDVNPQTRGYFALTTKGRHETARELEERRNQLMAMLVVQGAPQLSPLITAAKANLKTEVAKRDATVLREIDLIMQAVAEGHVSLNPQDLLLIHKELKRTNDALRQRLNVESSALVTALGECLAQYFEREAQDIGATKKVQRQAHLNCAALKKDTGNESDDEGAMQKTRDPIELFAELAISQPVKVGAFTILIQRSTDTEERP